MKRDGHNNVVFFVGPEVEHTPAYSKKTLFVVGKPALADIVKQAVENSTPHIFMGANHSFVHGTESAEGYAYWDKTISELLAAGYWVTLDYQAHEHGAVLDMLNTTVWRSRSFVPLLRVAIPHIETSSTNLTVKIDDKDFNATNPGVWCMSVREVTDSNRFTDWSEYTSDEVIDTSAKVEEIAAPVKVAKVVVEEVVLAVAEVPANNTDMGLDSTSVSKLKADAEEVAAPVAEIAATPEAAADAYAAGTTKDPLGEEASKKPKAKK